MNAVFADTFYWVALADSTDSAHRQALILTSERAASRIVTTEEVLTEFLNFFSTSDEQFRRAAGESVADLISSSVVRVLSQSGETFRAGLQLYLARADKRYSLTDCISMQAMRGEGLIEVLTNDHHFEQEGFRALFRESRLKV